MKVLIIHCTYKLRGGEETVVEEEIALLEKAGVDVELLLFTNEGSGLLKLLQLPFNISSYRKVKEKIKGFRPDVVHVHNLHFAASPSVVYAVKASGIPLVYTLHNYRLLCPSASLCHKGQLFLDSIHRTFPFEAVKKGVYKNSKVLTLWMAVSMQLHHWLGTWKKPDRYIVLSQHARDIFLRSKMSFSPEQLVTKPNFSAVPSSPQEKKSGEFVFVGRLTEEKGVRVLLKAFSTSKHQLVIAGDGPLKEDVVTCSRNFPNIRYVGSLPKAEVLLLLQRSAALIFPSVWFEGMPLTIIEAFASGTPVIASNLGAMPYMLEPGKNGFLFNAGDAADLLQKLNDWAALSTVEKESYATNARAAYEQRYTPEKNAEQLLSIYNSVQQIKTGEPIVRPAGTKAVQATGLSTTG